MSEAWPSEPLERQVEQDSPITYGVVKPGDPGEVPFVRGGDIADGRVLVDQLRTISDQVSRQYRRTLLQGGELLISLVGQPGQVAVAPPELAGANIARQVGLIRLSQRALPDFVSYFLQSPDGTAGLGARTGGSVQQVINLSDLRQVLVPTPAREEQQRLVDLLDKAFSVIATAKANVEKNLQNTREWSARQLAAALGAASAGGRSDTMEKLVAPSCTLSYGIVQPGDEVSGGLPVVRPVDLGGKTVYVDGLKRINPALARSYARTTLEGNDLLLCVRGTTGTVAMADPALAGANVTRGIVPIRFDPQTISQALGYYLLRSEPVQAQIRAKTYGTALMQINIGDLRKIVIAFPPLEKQAALVGQLDAIQEAADRLADVYARKLAALDELKHSLLHQAFAGGLSPQNDRPLHVHDLPLCTQ